MTDTGSLLKHLECRGCGATVDAGRPVGPCPTCGHTLFARYALDRLDGRRWRAGWAERPSTLWRYRELLPVARTESIVTLGEGGSPLLRLADGPDTAGVELYVKDDGGLPTGSFKARGMAVAVARAKELGLTELFVPSAGNAGVALSAYAARGGLRARIYLPERTPEALPAACAAYGAEVTRVPGTIREAGVVARETEKGRGSFDMSTLREPYRAEGKKTMGLEIFDQAFPDRFPDAILYPTGGGTGLIGMAKAFEELTTLGLLDRRPRLYAVQPEGCAPVVRALAEGAPRITPPEHPRTLAPGLLVPAPFASERILEAVRNSGGGGVAVSDAQIVEAMRGLARRHGLMVSPEAAAPYAALPLLEKRHAIRPGERVLLYLTGTGLGTSLPELERSLAS